MRDVRDTICAQATPPGEGGIAIVRMSGREAARILSEVFRPARGTIRPRMLTYGWVTDGEAKIDEAMAVLLPGPRSYTREDVAEIHCHGSRAAVARILRLLIARGARPAEPGEFTYRAFVGGRIDLSQAEGIMRMIRADSDRAMRGAVRQMEGGVSSFIRAAREEIEDMLSALAAAIDFPDEVDETETADSLTERCLALEKRLSEACDPREGRIEEEGLRVALCGQPNAGKSSLLNALLGEDRAIVTAVPGTTRDVLSEKVSIGGLPVVLTDTAGLRETGDEVEALGVARAEKALREADVRLLVLDGSQPLPETAGALFEKVRPDAAVISKGDLPRAEWTARAKEMLPDIPVVEVSSKTGEGLSALADTLRTFAPEGTDGGAAITQMRHVAAAQKACRSLSEARKALSDGFGTETAGIDLSAALDALGEITGETMNEAVIDRVFSKFCVGK